MKNLLIILLLACSQFSGLAQHASKPVGIIVGNVHDSTTGRPVSAATLIIAQIADSGFSRSLVLADDGYFAWDNLPFGYYRLSISAVGYHPLVIDSIHLRSDRYDFHLGDLQLHTKTSDELPTVVVFVERPLMENKDGKVTYNAGDSPLSSGGSTADLLRNMPMIGSDPNGKILLKGKAPRILIDEKPVDLNAQQLSDLLESLPGGAIEKIELMQNPPPEYASEEGGVINIVTRKGKIGFTGRVNASYGTRGEANLGVNMGYRTARLNLSGNLNSGGGQIAGESNSQRENIYKDSTNQLHTESSSMSQYVRPNLRVQADYDFNKRNQLGVVLQANSNLFDNESLTRYTNINQYDVPWRMSDRKVNSQGDNLNINPQLSYTWKGKTNGENLKVIVGVAGGYNHSDRLFYQTYLDPETEMPNGLDSTQQQLTRNKFLNTSSRVNYQKPMKAKGLTLSLGAGLVTTRTDNQLESSYLDKSADDWVNAPLLSNEFLFNQAVSSGRAGFTWRWGKGWRAIPYVHLEHTRFSFDFKELPGSSNSYVNWLPGVTVRKDLNKEHNINFVYRKTIRRPEVNELNPAIDYADPYNLRSGNPLLDPSTAHNFDLNYGYSKGKSYVNASLGHNIISDIITPLRSLIGDGKTLVTYRNIATRREYEAGLWGGYSFSKMFRLNMSLGYNFSRYNEEDIQKYRYRNGSSWFTNVNYSLLFSPVFSMEGNFRFNSTANPQGKSRSNLNMNLGVQRKFFDRRLILGANIIDPFTTENLTTYTEGTNFRLNSFRSQQTRNFRFSVAWQLNKMTMPVSGSRKK